VHKLAVMINRTHLLAVLLLLAASPGLAEPVVATFSITAADPESGEVGVAVASRFFSVDSVVPYGEGAVGVVATQANGNVSFGPRGKQSAALIVRKPGTGYGGKNDRAIDIRVDDHEEPFKELGRLLDYAQMNYSWNEAWTAFTEATAIDLNPKLKDQAAKDSDLDVLRKDDRFSNLLRIK